MVVLRGLQRLQYTDEGTGSPLLLLSGLGATAASWSPLTAHLDAGFRLLAMENRGTHADDEGGDFSVRDMADDAVAVLDAAGLADAHVVGNSMGGMIAQELALRHPERVRSLTLAATSAGLPSVPSHPLLAWHLLRARQTEGERRARHLAACFLGPRNRDAGTPAVEGCLGRLSSGGGPRRQLAAALRWNSYRRLHRIGVPTLVLHGTHDRLFPVLNARLMARLIPTARLVLLAEAGHFFITDAAAEAAAAMSTFVADVDAGRVVALSRRERVRAAIATASATLAAPAMPALVTDTSG